MLQKRRLQDGLDDNRSLILPNVPTLNWKNCKKVSDGAPCDNPRVVSGFPEANLYDNNGAT
jgi:hypothetical protein